MALRTKTIEYAFNQNWGALAAATRYEFPTMSLAIPESASRDFKSAYLEINYRDNSATAVSQTASIIGIRVGSAAWSNNTVTQTITNSGEHQSFVLIRDVTSYFNTNYTGGSQNVQASVQFTAMPAANISAKLYLTYDWDDSDQTTRIKTVRIPLQGATNALTTTLTEIGTNEIPALDSWLPEESKSYKKIWLEIQGNNSQAATTVFSASFALDSESQVAMAAEQAALNSSIWTKTVWVRDDLNTATTHAFKGRVSTTGRYGNVSAILHTTYTYDHSATTRVMNSLVIPVIEESGFTGTSTTSSSFSNQELRISEPGNIQISQSALTYFYNATGTGVSTIRVAAGTAGFTSYTRTHGTLGCGQYSLQHRFDNDIDLNVGYNNLKFTYDQTPNTTHTTSNTSALAYVNYTSDVDSRGDGVHNQTRYFSVMEHRTLVLAQRWEANWAPDVGDTSTYRTIGVGFGLLLNMGAQDGSIAWSAQPRADEPGIDDGWVGLYTSTYDTSIERAVTTSYARARTAFRRYPNDPDGGRMALINNRVYRLELAGASANNNAANSIIGGVVCLWTYHNMGTYVSRSITGGDATTKVDVFDSGSNLLLYSVMGDSTGSYGFMHYDRARTIYSIAYNATDGKVGRSDFFTPIP